MTMTRAMGPAVLLIAAACGSPTTETAVKSATQRSISAGDTVDLRVGDSIQVQGTGITIVFRGVAADSRCPIDVDCVWEGDAHVQLDASSGDGTSTRLNLHTGPVEPAEAVFGPLLVRLVDVEPDPVSDRPIRAEDYVVRLVITQP